MKSNSELSRNRSLPTTIEKVSSSLIRAGRIAFWMQLVLGVVSAVLLVVAAPAVLGNKQKTSGIELAIFCAFCAVIFLGFALFFSLRFSQIGNKMQNLDADSRPKKASTLQVIKYGLIVNLTGIFLSILGAEALSGIVLLKVITVPQSIGINIDPNKLVNPADLLIIQANTNTIAAHFAGLVSTLWLLDRISKYSK
ncbi:MAG: DUF3611 family protein [Xenococcaceae cyanobacterium]